MVSAKGKPCKGTHSQGGEHDWGYYEKVISRDEKGSIKETARVAACKHCGKTP